ncbi:MAG: hypothetical protein ACRBEE_15705 [Arenicella sp.]
MKNIKQKTLVVSLPLLTGISTAFLSSQSSMAESPINEMGLAKDVSVSSVSLDTKSLGNLKVSVDYQGHIPVQGHSIVVSSMANVGINLFKNKIDVKASIDLPNAAADVDSIGRSFGNMGSAYKARFYHIGGTTFSGGIGNTINFTTRARIESWVMTKVPYIKCKYLKCKKAYKVFKTRTVRDTKTVTGHLHLNIVNGLPKASYAVNVKNVPGEFEQKLTKWFGVAFSDSINLALDKSVSEKLSAISTQVSLEAINGGKGIRLHVNANASATDASSIVMNDVCKAKADSFFCKVYRYIS